MTEESATEEKVSNKTHPLMVSIQQVLQQSFQPKRINGYGKFTVVINEVPMYNFVTSIIQRNFEHIFKTMLDECNTKDATLSSIKTFIEGQLEAIEKIKAADKASQIVKPDIKIVKS